MCVQSVAGATECGERADSEPAESELTAGSRPSTEAEGERAGSDLASDGVAEDHPERAESEPSGDLSDAPVADREKETAKYIEKRGYAIV